MTGRIIYSPRSEQQLDNLDEWISKAASPAIARQFVSAVIARIDSILVFPHAGAPRDEIRPGMRTVTYKKRTLISYAVDENGAEVVVNILGVFHGGQDWETALREEPDPLDP